jgi:hypothetical protein
MDMAKMAWQMPDANGGDTVRREPPLLSKDSNTEALAASPFGLLDARGCLRLVTDVVHEDDGLCLALACRALRDALGARFPACPRAGGRAVARIASRVTADGVLDLTYDLTIYNSPLRVTTARYDTGGAYVYDALLPTDDTDADLADIPDIPDISDDDETDYESANGEDDDDYDELGLRALPEGIGRLASRLSRPGGQGGSWPPGHLLTSFHTVLRLLGCNLVATYLLYHRFHSTDPLTLRTPGWRTCHGPV